MTISRHLLGMYSGLGLAIIMEPSYKTEERVQYELVVSEQELTSMWIMGTCDWQVSGDHDDSQCPVHRASLSRGMSALVSGY
jgi:hypothetical protein